MTQIPPGFGPGPSAGGGGRRAERWPSYGPDVQAVDDAQALDEGPRARDRLGEQEVGCAVADQPAVDA